MTQYYDFSFSLQPPVFSPTQLFFAQILHTQAQLIASQIPLDDSSALTHIAPTPQPPLDSHTPDSAQDSNHSKPTIFTHGFYTHAQFAQEPTLHFIIQTDHAPSVLTFAESIAASLPLSLGFCFLTLSVLDSLESLQPRALPDYTPHTHFCTATQTQTFLSSEHFGDFSLLSFAKPLAHTDGILTYLDSLSQELRSHKSVLLDTTKGFQECSLTPFEDTQSLCVMCDISSLKTFFRIHSAQVDILASFEKPSMRLVPKEVFASSFQRDSHGLTLVSLPYDPILQLLSALLLRDEITHFFLRDTSATPQRIFAHTPLDSHTLCVSESGLYLDCAQAHCDFRTLLHTNLAHHTPHTAQSSVVLYISSKHPSAILLQSGGEFKQILDVRFEANPKLIIESIRAHYTSGTELVANFSRRQDIALFEHFGDTSIHTDNLTHIFGIAALLLGMHPSSNLSEDTLLATMPHAYDRLLMYANGFLRPKGPRIDYILLRDEDNTLTLDYPRIFRSSMSFKCADMDNVILAYGFIDSFCEFLATLVRDIQTNHAFGENLEVLLCGDVFGQHIFFERILSFLPKNITLTLPQDGFLDYY